MTDLWRVHPNGLIHFENAALYEDARHRVLHSRRLRDYLGIIMGDGYADDAEHLQVRLHSVALQDKAAAIGQPLDVLHLSEYGAEVTAVRRGKSRIPFAPDTVLENGDVVVLRGNTAAIERAEKRLLHP